MGTGTRPPAGLAIGGSKSAAGAKGEASLRRAPADSGTTLPDRKKAGMARLGLIRPAARNPRFLQDMDTRQFLAALFLTYTTSDTSGAGS